MAYCRNGYGQLYYCNSGWYTWGRWVVVGVIILAVIFIFFMCSCFTARRRRKAGRKPLYGTGWAAGNTGYNPNYNNTQNAQAQPQYQNYNQQAPQGGYYAGQNGANQSYFGGQQSGVEAPSHTYQPPSGPPPGKYN